MHFLGKCLLWDWLQQVCTVRPFLTWLVNKVELLGTYLQYIYLPTYIPVFPGFMKPVSNLCIFATAPSPSFALPIARSHLQMITIFCREEQCTTFMFEQEALS